MKKTQTGAFLITQLPNAVNDKRHIVGHPTSSEDLVVSFVIPCKRLVRKGSKCQISFFTPKIYKVQDTSSRISRKQTPSGIHLQEKALIQGLSLHNRALQGRGADTYDLHAADLFITFYVQRSSRQPKSV
jgi:hypothetical protein